MISVLHAIEARTDKAPPHSHAERPLPQRSGPSLWTWSRGTRVTLAAETKFRAILIHADHTSGLVIYFSAGSLPGVSNAVVAD
jgi:hypothetical protein